jgi:hypothetical protein
MDGCGRLRTLLASSRTSWDSSGTSRGVLTTLNCGFLIPVIIPRASGSVVVRSGSRGK